MRRMVAGIGGIGLAIVLSQFPEYAQQYAQRLGGAVDELRVITEEFDRAAAEGGLSRVEALSHYNASNDEFLAGRGTSMTATFQRFEQLSAALLRIEDAGPAERLQALPVYLDTDIGRRTLEHYQPAVPVSPWRACSMPAPGSCSAIWSCRACGGSARCRFVVATRCTDRDINLSLCPG